MAAELPSLSRSEFADELRRAGCGPNEVVVGRLHAHYVLLREWAARSSLIGPGSAGQAVSRHYAESLLAAQWVPRGARLLDVGSGAGFPGWILAAATDARVVLTESRSRKAVFLRRAARQAGLSLEVLVERIDRPLPDGVPEQLDCLTLRAVSLPDLVWSDLVARLVPGGLVMHWAGEGGWLPGGSLERVDSRLLPGAHSRRLDLYQKAA